MTPKGEEVGSRQEKYFLLLFQIRLYPLNEELFLPTQVINPGRVVLWFFNVKAKKNPAPYLGSETFTLPTEDSKGRTRRGGDSSCWWAKWAKPGGVNPCPSQQAALATKA